MHRLIPAAIAVAGLIVCSADAAFAQNKKQSQSAGRSSFKECCERAYARYSVMDGKGHCTSSSDAQKDSFYQCIHNNNLRIISRGQQAH